MKRNAVYAWMLLLLAFVSCDQMEGLFDKEKNETENLCAVLEATTVPQAVVESFNTNFPGMAVVTWFDKDGVGFCALFIKDSPTLSPISLIAYSVDSIMYECDNERILQ